jgi:D-allose transport system substrate-binding protein
MKHTLRALTLVATLGSVASAQAADGGFAVLLKTLANPFWVAMNQGFEDGAKAQKIEFFSQAAENDQAAEPQLNLCNNMLQRDPKVLIVGAINATNLLPCLKTAQDKGVKVIDLDNNLDQSILDKAGIKLAFHIGSDNIAAGEKGAEWLASKLGKDAKGPVLVIEGLPGAPASQNRVKGFGDKLKQIAPSLKIVASLPGDWDGGKAANVTADTLTSHPDLLAVFCANDTMALGAVESVRAAGKGDQVLTIGVDGTTDAVKSIKAGRLSASVAQLPYLEAQVALREAKKVLEGQAVAASIPVDTLVLTKDVIEANKDPNLQFVK